MKEDYLINPPAIVRYAEKSDINIRLSIIAQKQKELTKSEFLHYLTHDVNNTINEDGRINMLVKPNGELFANSVSPFSKDFLLNIENNIKDLITALVNKKYLTYSSCEGHGLFFRRYVGLAFCDIESRSYVINEIKKLKIWGVEYKELNNVANQIIKIKGKDFSYQSKQDIISFTEKQKEEEIESFNIQFHKNYDNYCYLELIIYDKLEIMDVFKNPYKFFRLLYAKKILIKETTEKITNLINNSSFKKYKY